jgi:hypothetical protein
LRVRYTRDLFSPMTKQFGGYLGSGIVGEKVAVRGTPAKSAIGLVIEIPTTHQIEPAGR